MAGPLANAGRIPREHLSTSLDRIHPRRTAAPNIHRHQPGWHARDSAVVLGPGGPAGTAWMAGLAEGLRREGVDLGTADLIVGTSAGAIVGAILATGGDLARLAALPAPAGPGGRVRTDPDRLAEVFAALGDPGLERAGALRRAGRLAVIASTGTQEAAIARMRFLVGTAQWPDRPLLIPSVDAETGEAVIWDRHGAASLPQGRGRQHRLPRDRSADHHRRAPVHRRRAQSRDQPRSGRRRPRGDRR
jgi:hypothetical protein